MSPTKRTPILPQKERDAIKKWLEKERDAAGFKTWGDVAARYEVTSQELAMFFSGKRHLSPTVALRLAQALKPTDWSQRVFLQELAERAKIKNLLALPHESVASRVSGEPGRASNTAKVRAAYVVSEPFVLTPRGASNDPKGFAVELFKLLAGFLGIGVEYISRVDFQELNNVFRGGEVDIVVSAVLPSFYRSQFMNFSRPLPFLRLPVSAVVRRANDSLHVKDIVAWDVAAGGRPTLNRIRFLLVEGEMGDEFVHTFLPGLASGQIVREKSLEPPQLYKRMTETGGPDILIADMATCAEVCKQGPDVKALPESPDDPIKEYMKELLGEHDPTDVQLPALALYPVVFGLPKNDPSWKDLIDSAIEAVVTEGARPLLQMYRNYLQAYPSFKYFCTSDDETISGPARRAFKALFDAASGRLRKPQRNLNEETP